MKNIFLIDADETLLDFKRGEREQLFKTLALCGVTVEEQMLSRFHSINDALWKKLERGETTRSVLTVERFQTLFEEFHLTADAKEASEAYYAFMRQAAYLMDGAEEFLAWCKEHGRVYIVTNGSRCVQHSRLALSGIDRYADGVFISEEVGADKPSPLFAKHVEENIPNYQRERTVWLGDSLSSDMGCAKTANIDFILFQKQRPAGYEGLLARSYAEAQTLFLTL